MHETRWYEAALAARGAWWVVVVVALACALVWPGDASAQLHKSNTKYSAQQTASGRADIVPSGSDLLADLLAKPGRWHVEEPSTGSSVLRDLLQKPFNPAPDEFTMPAVVELQSEEPLGEVGAMWHGRVRIAGMPRRFKTEREDPHTGELRTVQVNSAQNFLQVIQ